VTGTADPSGDLAGRRVLVTGGSGFIGAHLVRRLLDLDCDVVAQVRRQSDRWRIAEVADSLELVQADLAALEPDTLAAALAGVEVVFHLAAAGVHPAAEEDAPAIVQTNVVGTLRLLEAARSAGVTRFVNCGSCFEYGPGADLDEDAPLLPVTEYGASKAAAGLLAHAFARRHGLPVVTLRPFTVYGPREAPHRLIPHVIRGALRDERIELTGGAQARDFVYVDDAVDAFIRAAVVAEAAGGTFNVATGEPVTVREVVLAILELTGSVGVPVFGGLGYRPTDAPVLSGSPRRASEVLGWRASTPLAAGLQRTIARSLAGAGRTA
jgi:UDP-glucose 4-epimerase